MLDILRHATRASFGEALAHLRCDARVSQVNAARSIGLTPAMYERIEVGAADLAYEQALALMHLFGATPAELSQLTRARLMQRLNGSAPPFGTPLDWRRDQMSDPNTESPRGRLTAPSAGGRHA